VTAQAGPGGASRARTTLLCAALACLPFLAWRALLGLPLMGWDAFPLVSAAKVESASDAAGLFTSELMGGRYPLGHYWRPLVHASFAIDRAVWGLEPLGYHLTDVAALAAGALATFALARRFAGTALAAAVAGALFALHPVHFDVLAAPARRADLLCTAAMVASLAAAASRKRGLATIAALAALAAKETGIATAPAVFVLVACTEERGSLGVRLASAARFAWPAFAATAVWFTVRAAVVGGLGGEARFDASAAILELPRNALGLVASALGLARAGFEPAAALGAIAALALVAFALASTSRERAAAFGELAFVALWLSGLAAVTGTSGVERAWYELPFVPPVAVLLAWIVARGVDFARERRAVVATLALAVSGAVLALAIVHGPLVRERRDLAQAGERTREFLGRFERALRSAAPGTAVELAGFAPSVRIEGREISLHAPYSLEAFAEIAVPEKRVRAVLAGSPFAAPSAGEVVVVLAR